MRRTSAGRRVVVESRRDQRKLVAQGISVKKRNNAQAEAVAFRVLAYGEEGQQGMRGFALLARCDVQVAVQAEAVSVRVVTA